MVIELHRVHRVRHVLVQLKAEFPRLEAARVVERGVEILVVRLAAEGPGQHLSAPRGRGKALLLRRNVAPQVDFTVAVGVAREELRHVQPLLRGLRRRQVITILLFESGLLVLVLEKLPVIDKDTRGHVERQPPDLVGEEPHHRVRTPHGGDEVIDVDFVAIALDQIIDRLQPARGRVVGDPAGRLAKDIIEPGLGLELRDHLLQHRAAWQQVDRNADAGLLVELIHHVGDDPADRLVRGQHAQHRALIGLRLVLSLGRHRLPAGRRLGGFGLCQRRLCRSLRGRDFSPGFLKRRAVVGRRRALGGYEGENHPQNDEFPQIFRLHGQVPLLVSGFLSESTEAEHSLFAVYHLLSDQSICRVFQTLPRHLCRRSILRLPGSRLQVKIRPARRRQAAYARVQSKQNHRFQYLGQIRSHIRPPQFLATDHWPLTTAFWTVGPFRPSLVRGDSPRNAPLTPLHLPSERSIVALRNQRPNAPPPRQRTPRPP